MGSGSYGPYSGTNGSSQPYAERYSVIKEELDKDMKDSDIYNSKTGYFKNPTATNLKEAITPDRIIFEGKSASGTMTYVMDKNGDIIFGKRSNPNNDTKRAPHPTLIGGKNPRVQCAGMITFRKGRIFDINNKSGHYRPNKKSMKKVDSALKKLYEKYPGAFDKSSKWRNEK